MQAYWRFRCGWRSLAKWKCTVCNFIYDEDKEEKRFRDLGSRWICPICGAPKSAFIGDSGETEKRVVRTTTVAEKIVEQLSAFGIKYIYGIPGDSNLPFIEALRKQTKIQFI